MGVRLVVGLVVVGSAAVVLAARAPSLLQRLRALPGEFSAAYHEREAELRAALLPDEGAVATARAEVARRRAAPTTPQPWATTEDDDLASAL